MRKEVRMTASEDMQSCLEDREKSDMLLELHIEALKASHHQQLEKMKLKHQAGLDRRTLQNSLLSTSVDAPLKPNRPQGRLHNDEGSTKSRGSIYLFRPQRSSSTPDLSSKMSQHKLNSSGTLRCTMTYSQDPWRKTNLCAKEPKQSTSDKEELDWAECQKQFRVSPVPEHIFKHLYDDIVQKKERVRQEGLQQRKEFLLSIQKPFRFHQREERRRDRQKPETSADKLSENKKNEGKRCVPKAITDPAISEQLKEKEQQRKIRIQSRAQETLKASSAPILSLSTRAAHQVYSSQKTKTKVLGFLDQRPTFQPKTNAKVPNFNKLHQTFQKEAQERTERRDVTLCQPFQLRTSALQPRHNRSSTDNSSKYTHILKRSISFSGLTSLSRDTLPMYITDAARKRSMAIRKSVELRESKEQQNAEWMRQHKINSQAMSRGVVARAKAMDPHRSLKEVFQEKLKQHRLADHERVKDYKKELKEMKARVSTRPYLFEQVSQKNAKSDAERRYRSTLEQEGLDENFVRVTGETVERRSSESTDDSVGDQKFETDIQYRKESGDESI